MKSNLTAVGANAPGFKRQRGPSITLPGSLKLPALGQTSPQARPKRVVVQRCPAVMHDPRYQCAPGEAVAGAGFVAAGVGRYLDG